VYKHFKLHLCHQASAYTTATLFLTNNISK